jgi:hypothetical protein
MFNPKKLAEEVKFICERHGDKIYDEENPEFYISEIYWCEIENVFKYKTERDEER